ncbi:T9SS type B sorting domain-containing protein [Flavobacterium sp. H122]|uniref:T9SS type B sorting domain-containing protein n=1 Tax=Flavobacterium sp. H122 TaxID=2529860 RepID=UPI0010A995EB|nr:choice-of-anchor L domain-containing protein [Flavobacterium sp. H122]
MKKIISQIILLIGLLASTTIHSQNIIVDDTYTAQQLIKDILINSDCAQITNFSASGGNFANGEKSYGYFTNSNPAFPFTRGVVLSTGKAKSAEGPNSYISDDGSGMGWTGDPDLNTALGVSNTTNSTILEFDFVPKSNKLSFEYIFASEEYHDAAQCKYSDGFAFLLKKAGDPSYSNLALIPGTTIPVKVTTVHPDVPGAGGCPAQNQQYFGRYNDINYPVNFNGQTAVIKVESSVQPGETYHIKLVIADEGNYRYDSAIFLNADSFNTDLNLGPDRLFATNNPYCSGDVITLNGTETGATNYKWFKDGDDLEINSPTYTITDNTNSNIVTYSVEADNGNCGKIRVQFAPLPALYSQTITQCDDNLDGVSTFNLTQLDNAVKNNDPSVGNITYYETLGGIAIQNPQNYISNSKTIYAEAANQYGCKNSTPIDLIVTSNPIIAFPYPKCDDDSTIDGFTAFDLTAEIASQIITSPGSTAMSFHKTLQDAVEQKNNLPNNYINSTKDTEIIYGRVSNGVDCAGIYKITLQINYIPRNTFNDENAILCQGEQITLSINAVYNSYTWSNGDASPSTTITSAGNYTVDVSDNNGCTAQKKYIVTQSAPASDIDAVIKEFSENNSIEITYTNNGGSYEFSIDGFSFQDSPVFNNVEAGIYTIAVRDKNGCLPVITKTVYVLDFPKFFTPNNDGFNDSWKIENIEVKNTIASIAIFNRYGKLIKFLSPQQSWDGTFLGQPLPADDYWFTINFIDGGSTKSHFTLKR